MTGERHCINPSRPKAVRDPAGTGSKQGSAKQPAPSGMAMKNTSVLVNETICPVSITDPVYILPIHVLYQWYIYPCQMGKTMFVSVVIIQCFINQYKSVRLELRVMGGQGREEEGVV